MTLLQQRGQKASLGDIHAEKKTDGDESISLSGELGVRRQPQKALERVPFSTRAVQQASLTLYSHDNSSVVNNVARNIVSRATRAARRYQQTSGFDNIDEIETYQQRHARAANLPPSTPQTRLDASSSSEEAYFADRSVVLSTKCVEAKRQRELQKMGDTQRAAVKAAKPIEVICVHCGKVQMMGLDGRVYDKPIGKPETIPRLEITCCSPTDTPLRVGKDLAPSFINALDPAGTRREPGDYRHIAKGVMLPEFVAGP